MSVHCLSTPDVNYGMSLLLDDFCVGLYMEFLFPDLFARRALPLKAVAEAVSDTIGFYKAYKPWSRCWLNEL